MQLLKRVKWVYVLLSVFLMGLGACLFLWPDIPAVAICCAIGGGAVVFGIVKIVLYVLREVGTVGEQFDFAIGAMCVIAGAILLIHPEAILSMIPQVLGVYMLIDCVFKLQITLDAKRLGNRGWWLSLAVTIICIVWGLLIIWRPFGLEDRSVALIAGGLIADGVQNLLSVIYMAATVRKTEAVDEPVAPAAVEPVPAEMEPAVTAEDIASVKAEVVPDDVSSEEDGAVMEINFDMTEEENHELHS